MTETKTNVAIVLDSSGSMSSMREEAIGLFNAQLDAVKKGEGDTALSLVLFGTNPTRKRLAGIAYVPGELVSVVHENVDPSEVDRLDERSYVPDAMTPMRDGIGRAIALLEKADDEDEEAAFLVIVVTDGMENASQEWSAKALSDKVTELQNTGRWTFALYGCDDLDLAELKEQAGFASVPVGNIATYDRSEEGMSQVSMRSATSTEAYMQSRAQGVYSSTSFTGEEEEE